MNTSKNDEFQTKKHDDELKTDSELQLQNEDSEQNKRDISQPFSSEVYSLFS